MWGRDCTTPQLDVFLIQTNRPRQFSQGLDAPAVFFWVYDGCWPAHINSTLAHALKSEVDRFNYWVNTLASTNVGLFLLLHNINSSAFLVYESFALAVRTWIRAVIQSWQSHFQSNELLLKTLNSKSGAWRKQLTGWCLSLTCSFSFC